jgi:RimJ/RimL family protein N-acetyltransferase
LIETERLILRPPTDADRDALFALNADPRVGEWLSGPMDRAQADALVDRMLASIAEHGFSLWPVERKADGAVIGMAGLIAMGDDLPPGPALEVGWRFAPETWGHGYATEAARAAIDWGFANRPEASEIVAITARTNLRSQAVMRRLGMVHEPWRDFDHPRVADGSPLKAHVTYSLKRPL